MSTKSGWDTYGITRDDFSRLWDLPYGKFSARIKVLAKEKYRKQFFPRCEVTITRTLTQTLVLTGESEASVKQKFYGSSAPFADIRPQERISFECRQI